MIMPGKFEQQGIRFLYPENWRLEKEESENGWSVTVQGPNTAFFLLSYDEDMPPTEQVLETTLDALRADYPDLEVDDRVETLAGQPAVGHDIQFTSLDLTNTCWTRSFYTDSATVLVMCQATDLDLDEAEPVLRAISTSLQVDEE
jgi:hypothetical protein